MKNKKKTLRTQRTSPGDSHYRWKPDATRSLSSSGYACSSRRTRRPEPDPAQASVGFHDAGLTCDWVVLKPFSDPSQSPLNATEAQTESHRHHSRWDGAKQC